MNNFVKVTHAQFFAIMGPRDVHPSLRGSYPYTSDWKLRDGRVIGRSTGESYEVAADLAQRSA